MDRRAFLTTAGALVTGATLNGCGVSSNEKKVQETPKIHEGLEILKQNQWHFLKQKGTDDSMSELKFDELEKWIGNNNSSVSFMLSACVGNVCPLTVHNLSELKDPNLKHIIISTDPKNDQFLRNRLTENFMGGSLKPENVYVLFPDTFEETREIEKKMGQILEDDDKPVAYKHSQFVLLYNKSGAKISEADGNDLTKLKQAYQDTQRSNPQKGVER